MSFQGRQLIKMNDKFWRMRQDNWQLELTIHFLPQGEHLHVIACYSLTSMLNGQIFFQVNTTPLTLNWKYWQRDCLLFQAIRCLLWTSYQGKRVAIYSQSIYFCQNRDTKSHNSSGVCNQSLHTVLILKLKSLCCSFFFLIVQRQINIVTKHYRCEIYVTFI